MLSNSETNYYGFYLIFLLLNNWLKDYRKSHKFHYFIQLKLLTDLLKANLATSKDRLTFKKQDQNKQQ